MYGSRKRVSPSAGSIGAAVIKRVISPMLTRSRSRKDWGKVIQNVPSCSTLAELTGSSYAPYTSYALTTGAEVSFRQVANTYANKVPNIALSKAFKANLEALGAEFPEASSERPGASTDFGTVSQAMPAATASIFIGENVALHSYDATNVQHRRPLMRR